MIKKSKKKECSPLRPTLGKYGIFIIRVENTITKVVLMADFSQYNLIYVM